MRDANRTASLFGVLIVWPPFFLYCAIYGAYGDIDVAGVFGYSRCILVCQQGYLSFQFLSGNVLQVLAHNSIRDLPHLKQIVLRCRAKNPRVIEVPAEVGNAVGVTTVHEEPKQGQLATINEKRDAGKDITYSSGGPSCASSGVCSSPARLRSQNMIFRS